MITFLCILLSPILALTTIHVVKELIFFFIYLTKYKKQNIPLSYFPILGWNNLIIPRKNTKSKNVFEHLLKETQSNFKNHKIIALNQPSSIHPLMILMDPKLIGDFFSIEVDNFKRDAIAKVPLDIGFLMEYGHEAMKKRAIFNNFFQIQNLKNLTKNLRGLIEEHFLKLKNDLWKDGTNEFKTYDLRKMFPPLFEDVVNKLLFGNSEFPLIDGKTMPTYSQQLLEEFSDDIMRSPLNFVTFNALHNFKIFPKTRELDKRVDIMKKNILESVEKRRKLSKSERGINILDVMLNHNDTCQKGEELSDDDFIQNIFLFHITGYDTSNNITESLLKFLSFNGKIIDKMQNEELKKIFEKEGDKNNYDSYFKSEYMNKFINEVLRLNPVLPLSIGRMAMRDVKVGPYKIYKGTQVIVPIYPLHHIENNFENASKLDTERFSEKKSRKIKRNTYLPFMGGKRACIGKYLAELIIRINVSTFLDIFEMEAIEGEEFKNDLRLVAGVKDCKVKFKPRL